MNRLSRCSASLSVFPTRWNLRLGYRSNLSNDGLEYLSTGATVFDVLSVDVSTTLDSVKINGSDTPRGAAISLGLNFRY